MKLYNWNLLKYIYTIIIFLAFISNSQAADPAKGNKSLLTPAELAWVAEHPVIRVGVDHYPPFEIVDGTGNYEGFGAEYLRRIGEHTGLNFKIVTGLTWAQVLGGAENGSVDLIPVITKSQDRSKFLLFTEAYLKQSQVVITRKEHPAVKGIADLKEKTMAVSEGYSEIEELNRDFPSIKQVVVRNPLEELKLLSSGQVDACQGNIVVINYYIHKYNLHNLKVAGPSETGGGSNMGMGIRKDWPMLHSILEKGLRSISEPERIAISRKWAPGLNEEEEKSFKLTSEEQVWLDAHPVIRVGSDTAWAPMEYADKNGIYKGISIDYLRHIEKSLGVRFEIVRGQPWHKLINMAKEKKIDMFSCVAKTPERNTYLSFSSPYATSPVVIFSRTDTPYIGDLSGLEGKKVTVVKGFATHETLSKEHPQITLVPASDLHQALDMLNSGEVYAYVGSLLVTSYNISERGYNLIKVAGKTPYELSLGMASRNDWPVFAGILQKAINSISEAERNKIYRKWSSVTYEHGFDYSLIWRITAGACFLFAVLFFWNRRLKHQVEKKTADVMLNEERLEALLQIAGKHDATEQELSKYALEEAVRLTRSKGGYFHFYDENTKDILLNIWNQEVMKDSQTNISGRYPLEKAGIWADCIRKNQPVVHNDYSLSHDGEKTSEGHLPIRRHMSIPIIIDDHVMALAGVANKEAPYDKTDIRQLTLLMNETWQIIQRKRAQKDLHLVKHSIEQSAYPFLWVQEDSQIFYANEASCRSLGYTHEELCSMRISQINPDFPDETWPDFWKRLKTDKSLMFETRHQPKTGNVFPVEISANHLEFEGQEHVFAYVIDISARVQYEKSQKNLEKQLQQAQKMEAIGTLAGGIAHDFNNILSSILGYTELARMDIPDDSDTASYIDQVLKAGTRAGDLVKQILTFSRKQDQELKPLKVGLVVKEAIKLLRSSIPSSIKIKSEIDSDCGLVLADPTRIHQIIMNLCTNAYHAMKKSGGELAVALRPLSFVSGTETNNRIQLEPGSYLELIISDTGSGIPKEHLEKIFEPYFTTKEKGEGTGLGLAMVHGIIKDLRGDIDVKSSVGKGTAFYIYLPVIKGTEKTIVSPKDTTPLPKGEEHILFVDDEKSVVDFSKIMLKSLGYKVIGFTDSQKAFEAFKNSPDDFDLIITDMTMPNKNGGELTREILEIKPDMPVILCTGYSDQFAPDQFKQMGIRGYLEKPILKRDLAIKIRNIFDKNNA